MQPMLDRYRNNGDPQDQAFADANENSDAGTAGADVRHQSTYDTPQLEYWDRPVRHRALNHISVP